MSGAAGGLAEPPGPPPGTGSVSRSPPPPPPAEATPSSATASSATASSDTSSATSAADGGRPAHQLLRELLNAISAYNTQRGQTATAGSTTLATARGTADASRPRRAAVDLLISVDTAMAHLAGGMGLPVWMLSRFDACWRWLERRADTPRYPSMRIFHPPAPDDWAAMIQAVTAALQQITRY